MARLHLFEWKDQSWFPEVFRNINTDHFVFDAKRLNALIVPILAAKMLETGNTNIINLCSGGGPLEMHTQKCEKQRGYI